MIVPKFLVPVDANLADIATAQERLKDGRARRTPTFAYESKQTGIALRKDLFAEAMLENSPTRPPRRVGDFVVSATVQLLFLAVLLLIPLYFDVLKTLSSRRVDPTRWMPRMPVGIWCVGSNE